jgi:hypothetical protein
MNSSGLHISKHDRRRYRDALVSVSWNGPLGEDLRRLHELLEEKTVAKVRPLRRKRTAEEKASKAAKLSKRAARHRRTSDVRIPVMKRAGLVCECGCKRWFKGFAGAATMDHFFGKARAESVETCWALRADCHAEKTDNKLHGKTDRAAWLRKFIAHCDRYGYSAAAEEARAELESQAILAEAAALTGGSR